MAVRQGPALLPAADANQNVVVAAWRRRPSERVIFDLRRCAHARGRTSVDKPVRNRTFIGPAARLCSRAAPSFEQRLRTATGVAKLVCSHRDSSSCVPHLACRRLGRCRSAGGKPGLRAGLRKLPVGAVYVGNFTAGAAGANCNDGDVSRASRRELEAMMISSKPRPFLASCRPFHPVRQPWRRPWASCARCTRGWRLECCPVSKTAAKTAVAATL